MVKAGLPIEAWRRHHNTVRPHSSLGYCRPPPRGLGRAALRFVQEGPAGYCGQPRTLIDSGASDPAKIASAWSGSSVAAFEFPWMVDLSGLEMLGHDQDRHRVSDSSECRSESVGERRNDRGEVAVRCRSMHLEQPCKESESSLESC